jgi:cbb3-type cytochrome oxidase subunit 3
MEENNTNLDNLVVEKKYLDDESKMIIKFFKTFNVILLLIALIGSTYISYTTAEKAQQTKALTSWSIDDDDYFSSSDSYNNNTKVDGATFIMIWTLTIAYSIFQFYLIKLIVKHFENTAELKTIQKEILERRL